MINSRQWQSTSSLSPSPWQPFPPSPALAEPLEWGTASPLMCWMALAHSHPASGWTLGSWFYHLSTTLSADDTVLCVHIVEESDVVQKRGGKGHFLNMTSCKPFLLFYTVRGPCSTWLARCWLLPSHDSGGHAYAPPTHSLKTISKLINELLIRKLPLWVPCCFFPGGSGVHPSPALAQPCCQWRDAQSWTSAHSDSLTAPSCWYCVQLKQGKIITDLLEQFSNERRLCRV